MRRNAMMAAFLALLATACTAHEGKQFACDASATVDGWFGQGPSEERKEDCR